MSPGLSRVVTVAVVVAAVVAGAHAAGAAPRVDHKRLAKQVAAAVAPTHPDLPITGVSCPKRIPGRVGAVTICDVMAGELSLQMKVTQTDASGNVTIESTQAVIPKASAEAFVQNNATLPVQVDCGADAYIVRLPGTPFACTARFGDGTTQQVLVSVQDVAGNVAINQVL